MQKATMWKAQNEVERYNSISFHSETVEYEMNLQKRKMKLNHYFSPTDLLMISRRFIKLPSPATICGAFQRFAAHYSWSMLEQLSSIHLKFRKFLLFGSERRLVVFLIFK